MTQVCSLLSLPTKHHLRSSNGHSSTSNHHLCATFPLLSPSLADVETGGVTCACAEEQKAKARPGQDCVAHEGCPYAKEGKCSCSKDTCVSSQVSST